MKKLFTYLSALLLFTTASVAQDKAVDDPRGAIAFIETIAQETIAAWSDSKLNQEERDAAFRSIFAAATDVELIARGILGRHYKRATPEQRQAYMKAMRDYIITEFDKRMSQIGFRELDIVGTTPASGRSGHLFVRTKVDRDEGQALLADWRVRKKDGVFQVVNLEIEGINLMITNREYFSSRVKALGLEGMISELESSLQEEAE